MIAVQDILATSQQDFNNEAREKQDILDNTNKSLKESSSALAEERGRLEELQAKAREKDELRQKIQNLQRSAMELRQQISQSHGTGYNSNLVMENVTVGEADKGLDFGGALAEIERVFPHGDVGPHTPMTSEQTGFLASLERAEVLSGRVKAYQQHNEGLEAQARELKSKSQELEERYKRMVSLCTKVDVNQVENVLDSLLQAVVSEQKEHVELGRVREFLRMVQGTDV